MRGRGSILRRPVVLGPVPIRGP